MRIGIVSEYVRPWPGGISEHVHHEAEGLRRRGHWVQVISGPGPSQRDVVRLPYQVSFGHNGAKNRLSFGPELALLRRRFAADRLDVLHVHAPLDPLLPLLSVLAAPCAVVGTFHASFAPSLGWDIYHGLLTPLARRALDRLVVKVAVSEEAQRSLGGYFDVRCLRIPNGIDLARFAPQPGKPSTVPRILFVGRPDPRKGLPVLLDAFERLTQRMDARLELVGVRASDLSPRQRPNPRIVCHGVVEPELMAQHFAAADLVCAPSLHGESQGVVLLEAMAAGKALVCSDIPGYRELVRHDRDGRLVPKQDPAALAAELFALLTAPERREALGKAARARAESFGWEPVLDALEGALREACTPGANRTASVPAWQAHPWS